MSFRHRSRAFAVLICLILGSRQIATAQRASSDERAIRDLVEAHAIAWNKRDPKAAAAVVTADAVWITSSGQVLQGRAAIERAHVKWLAEDAATGGSTHVHPPSSITIRFIRPDVAVADLESQYVGAKGPDGKVLSPTRSLLFIVVTKDGSEWRIAQVRNTGQPSQ